MVSGESLYARPEMLRLLQDVEDGRYDAVLVMDLDRLSRGRMKDQGIILDAFRDSGTLIITPEHTYNLSDDLDDEMAEFKTFMSRREYKIINKRLRRGLKQTIQDGCYVANAPYGYRKVTVDRKPTLEIYEPEAKFVRMMYDLYLQGYGCVSIARHVNALGAKPHRSAEFTRNSVAHILRNPTFAGKIVWDQKTHIRKGAKGNPKHVTIYNPREKWTIVDGIHPAIIDQETYDKVQAIMAGRYIPSKRDGTVRSPLAGLVRAPTAGGHMQRMTMKGSPTCSAPAPAAAPPPSLSWWSSGSSPTWRTPWPGWSWSSRPRLGPGHLRPGHHPGGHKEGARHSPAARRPGCTSCWRSEEYDLPNLPGADGRREGEDRRPGAPPAGDRARHPSGQHGRPRRPGQARSGPCWTPTTPPTPPAATPCSRASSTPCGTQSQETHPQRLPASLRP